MRRFFFGIILSLGILFPGLVRAADPYTYGPASGALVEWRYDITYYPGTQEFFFKAPVIADNPVSWQTEVSREDRVLVDGREIPFQLTTDSLGNMFLSFEATDLSPTGGTIQVVTEDGVADRQIESRIDPSLVTDDYSSLPDLSRWTSPENFVQSTNPAIQQLAQSLQGGETNPYVLAHRAYVWVNQNLTYDETGTSPYDDQGALSALEHRTGVCLDYASLEVALLRAMGVPARLVDGVRPLGPIPAGGENIIPYLHTWTQVYLPPYGWVDIDPTFTDTVNGQKVTPDTSFGQFAADDPHIFTDVREESSGSQDGSIAYQVRYIYQPGTMAPRISYSGEILPLALNTAVTASAGAGPAAFSDVPGNFWAAQAISALTARGILKGYPDGTFRPGNPVTRAEMVAILARLLAPGPIAGSVEFPDVPPGYWAYQDIEKAAALGWIQGEPDGDFHPDDALTRGQLAAILSRALHLVDDGRRFSFSDCPPGRWYYLPLNLVWQAGLVQGVSGDRMDPDGPATRAQVAEILWRYEAGRTGA